MNAAEYIKQALDDQRLTFDQLASLVKLAQAQLGFPPNERDGKPGSNTLACLHDVPDVAPTLITDRRSFHTLKYTPRERPWSDVTGVCLHQTACDMGERVERYNGIGAHFAVTRSGKVLWMADLNRVIYHGNGWNNRTVGIEINGLFAGIEGDPKTVWDDPSTELRETAQSVTPEQISATKELIRWIQREVAQRGGSLTKLVAHRQSSKDRRNDPGSKVWQEIALPMMRELHLDDGGEGFEVGGYPIPFEWDPSRAGHRY